MSETYSDLVKRSLKPSPEKVCQFCGKKGIVHEALGCADRAKPPGKLVKRVCRCCRAGETATELCRCAFCKHGVELSETK